MHPCSKDEPDGLGRSTRAPHGAGYEGFGLTFAEYADRTRAPRSSGGTAPGSAEHAASWRLVPTTAATSNRRSLLSSLLMTTSPVGSDSVHDRPTAAELLDIVAETLSDTVLAATAPHAQHQVRVAANLCRVVAREINAGDATSTEHREIDLESAGAYEQVKALVRAKLAVAKPGYDAHDADAEEALIVR